MKLYCYARVSTDDQSDSIDTQKHRLTEFAKQASMEFGGLYADEGVSAYKNWLRDRPEGKKLWDAVAPGDVVAVVAQDRLFRDVADAAITFRTWNKIGIRIFDMQKGRYIDAGDDQTLFEIIAVLSNDFSRRNGRRVHAAFESRRKQGLPYSRTRPWGWLRKGNEYIPCPKERALGEEVIAMRKGEITYAGIACALAKRGTKKPVCQRGDGYYSLSDVYSLYRAAVNGYPRIAPALLKSAGYEEKLREAANHASPRACGA